MARKRVENSLDESETPEVVIRRVGADHAADVARAFIEKGVRPRFERIVDAGDMGKIFLVSDDGTVRMGLLPESVGPTMVVFAMAGIRLRMEKSLDDVPPPRIKRKKQKRTS